MTKAEFKALQNDAYSLALDIGLRPAARALGIGEDRVRRWSSDLKWGFSKLPLRLRHAQARNAQALDAANSPPITTSGEIKAKLLASLSDQTRLSMATAACKAGETLADRDGDQLVQAQTAIAADTWSKVGDRVHGWSAERQQGTTVQVANLVMPSEVEREERSKVHDKLDAIARALAKE